MSDKNKKMRILVVDDEESIREFLSIMLKREGYAVETLGNPKDAAKALSEHHYDLAISDITMPQMSGLELLSKIKEQSPDTAVIMITAYGSTESAVEAMKRGAADYIQKPFQLDEIKLAIQAVYKTISLERENRALKEELNKTFSFENIIGNAPAMQVVFDMIRRVSQTKANILILGESGTGKELVAHAIHRSSAEKDKAFVAINCGAIPENLLESELFGHKKGSFTGATSDKPGLFLEADGGTLFLDEVGNLPLNLQVKLLRAIQNRTFRPVGGIDDISSDIRFICATNSNLEEAVKAGTFREDLYYRLNVIQIPLPPLRERKEDIPMLAKHFLQKFNESMRKSIKTISQDTLILLKAYNYPGNVRELENTLERAVALETKESILPESLPEKIRSSGTVVFGNSKAPTGTNNPLADASFNLERQVEEFERKHILAALEKSSGVKKRAAEILGISFRSLRYRIEKYGIEDPNPQEFDS